MVLGDLVYNDDFDVNCNYAVYEGTWNDGGTLVWSTRNNRCCKPPCALLDKKIKYITIDVKYSEIVIEVE